MNKKIRVLVFPCGSENASEINDALKYSVHVELWGASSISDFGRLNFKNYIPDVPFINDPTFESYFLNMIRENEIDMVFATHDSVLKRLADFSKENFFLVNGHSQTASLARSKRQTYSLFKDFDWCPVVYDGPQSDIKWPVIMKPDTGQGAQGVHRVDNIENLNALLKTEKDSVIVEYLPGQEITVDCFTNWKNELIYVGPRTRERVRAGITMKSSFIHDVSVISDIAQSINENVEMRGPWFFQLKKDVSNNWKLLEISCRIAGTMVAQRVKGVNLPLLAVQDFMERDVICLENPYVSEIERRIITKSIIDYDYQYVYVDLDDTLIVNNKVCVPVISFIYQSVNSGKKVVLISRHEYKINETLEKYAISCDLFDSIIHIEDKSLKSNYIISPAIFIDNYFSERYEVFRSLNIPCFDVDAVEFFLI